MVKMNLSKKIALFVGILVLIVTIALGAISVKLSSSIIIDQAEASMLEYATQSAAKVEAIIDKRLSVLNEVATRARLQTMDWAVQEAALAVDV